MTSYAVSSQPGGFPEMSALNIIGDNAVMGYLGQQETRNEIFDNHNNTSPSNEMSQQGLERYNTPQGVQNASCIASYPLTGGVRSANTRDKTFIHREKFETLPQIGSGWEGGPYVPTNDPTSTFLLDIKNRPMTDFVHNNMVPFYGSSVKQNMAGTGVASGNYIDGVDVNSGFDGRTPFDTKLSLFTGTDSNYLHKREIGPKFSPAEQQTGWVYGTPAFRPELDRYTNSLWIRNDLAPCEKEMVGPGLNIGAEIPAQGGFHDFTRILPNNVSDYYSNQLEGRVIAGKLVEGAELPTAYPGVGVSGKLGDTPNNSIQQPGVTKNRPNSFWTQSRRPTMTTKVGFIENLWDLRSDWRSSFKPSNAMREQTNYGFGELVPK